MTAPTTLTPKARVLLDAASELFYERGIHAVGVDVIAEHAGVTKKTLYDRFGSKDGLVVEYLSERDRVWRDFLDRRRTAAGGSPADQVSAVFAASAAWAEDRGHKGCSMINAHAEISDPDHPAYPVIVGQKAWMLALFVELAEAADVADPQRIGEQIMVLHEGALVMAGTGTIGSAFELAADTAVALVA